MPDVRSSAGARLRSDHPRRRSPAPHFAVLVAAFMFVGACGGGDSPGSGSDGGSGGAMGGNQRIEPEAGTGGPLDMGSPIPDPDAGTDTMVEPDLGAPDVVTGPPSIVSTSPANEAKDVVVDSSVIIEFSKPMNRTSVTVTFAPPLPVRPATWSLGSETLTLTPQTAFAASTMYTVTVAGSDAAGAALTGSKTFAFLTGTPPDMTAPTIMATTPAAGATGVALKTAIAITFSEAMDPTTVTAKLGDEPLDLTFNAAGTIATAGDAEFKPATMYTVTVAGSDVAGNMLGGTKTFAFTTAAPPDTERPKVVDTTPDNGGTGVATATEIAFMFSEAMNRATTEAAIAISGGVSCAGRWLWNTANNFMSCKPAAALAFSTNYTVTVSTGATDTAGNGLMAAHTFSFTTATLPDLIPPTITAVAPANASNGVARTAPIVVTFSEPMDLASAQTAFQATVNGTAITAAGTYGWSNGGRTLTFKPNVAFPYGATVGFSVSMAAKDAAGNAKIAANAYTFTVIRLLSATLYSVPAQDGYVYSTGSFFAALTSTLVGDVLTNAYAHTFLTFNLAQLNIPAAMAARTRITGATLYLNQSNVVGTPYGATGLGDLLVDHVSYGPTLDASDLTTATILGTPGRTYTITSAPTSTIKFVSVLTAVTDDFANVNTRNSVSQFRVRFTKNLVANMVADYVSFISGDNTTMTTARPRIIVSYETP
jgi:hypothetical protein